MQLLHMLTANFAALVASTMSGTFADEGLRKREFWRLLDEEFNATFQCAKYGKAESDGSFLHLGGWSTLIGRMR